MFGSHSYAGAQPCTSNEFASFSLHILNGPEFTFTSFKHFTSLSVFLLDAVGSDGCVKGSLLQNQLYRQTVWTHAWNWAAVFSLLSVGKQTTGNITDDNGTCST